MPVKPATKPATSDTVYEPVPNWGNIPHGTWLKEATAVAVDSDDRVYLFNRGNRPVLVFDPDGNVVDSWGTDDPFSAMVELVDPYGNKVQGWAGNRYRRAHAITIDAEDNVWLVDDVGHSIYKNDKKGNQLLRIGTGEPAPRESGDMFNKPTDVAISATTGEVFITDGYGNSRVHRLDAEGNHIQSWGASGTGHGQFSLPHNLALVGDDRVIVCDRENHRVQMFTLGGEFLKAWHVHKAVAVEQGKGEDTNIYIAEQGPPPVQRGVENLGHRVGIYSQEGELITHFGAALPGEEPDQFLWPHSLAIDSRGDVYVAEVSFVEVGQHLDPPRAMMSIRKWRRVSG